MRAGLGSSGAATVAGLRLYESVTSLRPVEDWLRLATEVEGHPDNAAASLLGGLTSSCQLDDGRAVATSRDWPQEIEFCVFTPHAGLETSVSRGRLPATIDRRDAVFNLQRALLLLGALEERRYDLLREALRDRWHQPHRAPLVPGLSEILALEHPNLLGACLSGAGPSIAVLTTDRGREVSDLVGAVYRRLGVPCSMSRLRAEPRF
jgi:homoserine kinase